ncbi:hypothetical protein GIB67_041132 [Kingdonia uniflora]|uniref:Cytochrome P450 n=1 Tax=Kingdonia uniflora TaxID=39325 RepID=A0A7J7LKL1_9MAGN|nr:hypothetical protein GIB67_041132 [Kingdonia uniflora]
MKYTWRVAQEIMKLTPSVSSNFKTTIKDTSFGGFDIPKGWRVFWFAPATHLDEIIFEEPEKFDPSRFENLSKYVLPYTNISVRDQSDYNTKYKDMAVLVLVAITLVFLSFVFKLFRRNRKVEYLPRGSLGFPLIGESLSFVKAQKENRGEEWINERISKHGPVFKTSLMGFPTVVITGQAGNKFVLGSDSDVLTMTQPMTVRRVVGDCTLTGLSKPRYKLVKGAMMSFLKPESLQSYVSRLDEIVNAHIVSEIKEKESIKAVDFMKKLTFDVTFTILFGIDGKSPKEAMFHDFDQIFKAVWSVPLNFPGTIFHQGLQARSRVISMILPILMKRKQELLDGTINPRNDLLTWMLAVREENQEPITRDELIDNFIGIVIASHDTTSILLSLMMWKLARDPKIVAKVREGNHVHPTFASSFLSFPMYIILFIVSSHYAKSIISIISEQMEIFLRKKGSGEEKLAWTDLQSMKYTWRVAQELMRIIPPVFGNFREAAKDLYFCGCFIPKGWQVFWVSHGTQMNEDIFENPKVFDPSRFENPTKPIPPFTYVPFGGGPHMCSGNEFARVEILTIIHHMVTKFEWSQVIPDETITRQPLPYPSMGLPINIKSVNQS